MAYASETNSIVKISCQYLPHSMTTQLTHKKTIGPSAR
jgi:hypothetical protein